MSAVVTNLNLVILARYVLNEENYQLSIPTEKLKLFSSKGYVFYLYPPYTLCIAYSQAASFPKMLTDPNFLP